MNANAESRPETREGNPSPTMGQVPPSCGAFQKIASVATVERLASWLMWAVSLLG